MTETKWTKRVCEELRRCNTQVVSLHGGSVYQTTGIPDRYIIHTVWNGWLEFKGPSTKLKGIQARFIKLHELKWPTTAYVVREPDRIEDSQGELLMRFDGTGKGLLDTLGLMRAHAISMGRVQPYKAETLNYERDIE